MPCASPQIDAEWPAEDSWSSPTIPAPAKSNPLATSTAAFDKFQAENASTPVSAAAAQAKAGKL